MKDADNIIDFNDRLKQKQKDDEPPWRYSMAFHEKDGEWIGDILDWDRGITKQMTPYDALRHFARGSILMGIRMHNGAEAKEPTDRGRMILNLRLFQDGSIELTMDTAMVSAENQRQWVIEALQNVSMNDLNKK